MTEAAETHGLAETEKVASGGVPRVETPPTARPTAVTEPRGGEFSQQNAYTINIRTSPTAPPPKISPYKIYPEILSLSPCYPSESRG